MVLPANPYFRSYSTTTEQNILDRFVVESIDIYGFMTYYIPRIMHSQQRLYDTSDLDEYKDTYPISVAIENVMGFKGDREYLSKFSGTLAFHDQIIVAIAKTTFDQEIGVHTNFKRPREGDIIFFPFNNRIFQIKYVDKFETLFQLGTAPYLWRCTCEMFEYSNEIFNTGIDEIDAIQETASFNLYDWAIKDTDGKALKFENGDVWTIDSFRLETIDTAADNIDVEEMSANTVQEWTRDDPYEESGSGKL